MQASPKWPSTHTDKRQKQQKQEQEDGRAPACCHLRLNVKPSSKTDEQRLSRKLNSKLQRAMLFKHGDDTADQAGHTQDAQPVDKTK